MSMLSKNIKLDLDNITSEADKILKRINELNFELIPDDVKLSIQIIESKVIFINSLAQESKILCKTL